MKNITWRVSLGWACVAVFVAAADANYPNDPYAETQILTVADPEPVEDLGFSLAASNGLAISGALNGGIDTNHTTGAVYAYRQTSTGQWSQIAKLLADDGISGDGFGWEVALDGDWAVISADVRGFQTSNAQYGATYFFHRDTDSIWTQANEFAALPNTKMSFNSVGISGPRAVATGAFQTNSGVYQGVVEVFEQPNSTSWANTQRITLPGPTSSAEDVAMSGTTLAVGNFRMDVLNGPEIDSVEVYERSPSGYVHSASIMPASMPASFGLSVALQNDRLLIGAPDEAGHGGAYVYERGPNDSWIQAAHLTPTDLTGRYLIGTEVALDGDLAYLTLIDAPGGFGNGRVDVFQRNSVGSWNEIAELSSPSAQYSFGYSLAAVNGQALIGSSINAPGAIHIFSQVPEPELAAYAVSLFACLTLVLPGALRGMRQV